MAINIFLRLIVDRIRFFVLIDATEMYGVVWSQLKEISAMNNEFLPDWKLTVHKMKHGKTQLRFRPEAKRCVAIIEIGTTNGEKRYFSLDLFPSKFQAGEFDLVKEVLTIFLDDLNYEKLFYTARVSYLELAADSLSHPMSSFLPFRTRTFSSYVYPLKEGKGSIYCGAENGKLRFCIYDKKKQIEEKLKQIPSHAMQTRIEARVHTTGLTAAQLKGELKNPFKRLEIADLQKLKQVFKHPGLPAFLDECHGQGAEQALGKLSVKDRRRYLIGLRKAKAEWWKPEWIWQSLPDALSVIKP